MDATIKEIATLLRSTDEMAEQFIQRVQTRVGEPVSHAEILATMKKIPPKSLTMEKVVVKLKQKRKSTRRRAAQHQTTPQNRATAAPKAPANSRSAHARTPSSKAPKSVLDQLDSVLEGNWDRAEAEGLRPTRLSAEAFMSAIYQYTDRREGSRRRILQAAQQLDQDDVMLTPALVADVVHEIFKS